LDPLTGVAPLPPAALSRVPRYGLRDDVTVRHARAESLDQLEPLLAVFRTLPGLQERGRGVFYRRSRAFAHFHEDPAGLFIDIRVGADFERWPVGSDAERRQVIDLARGALTPPDAGA
jgi:hypothetical protein